MEMSDMEVKSKEDYFRQASKHLKQALDNVIVAQDSITVVKDYTLEAMDWLRAGAALIPDESKTIQGLKAALVESLQREEGLSARLASSEAPEFRVVEKKLAESVEREKALQRQVIFYVESEQRLVTALERLLGEARKLTPSGGHAEPAELSGPGYTADGNWDVGPAGPVVHRPSQYPEYKQWHIPDVTCSAEPVKPDEPKPSGPPNIRVPLW